MAMAFATKTKFPVVRLKPLATTTPRPPTTTVLALKKTFWECAGEAAQPMLMKTASAMTLIRALERWTTAVYVMETTLLAPVVPTIRPATTKEPPLTMALVCMRMNVACVEVLVLQTALAIVTATFSMSVASVAVLGLPMVHAIALEMCSTLVVFAADRVLMRMPTAFVTTLTIASVNSTSAEFAMAMVALVPIHALLQVSRALTR